MCIGVSFKSTEVLNVVLSSQFRVEYRWHTIEYANGNKSHNLKNVLHEMTFPITRFQLSESYRTRVLFVDNKKQC